MWGVIPFTGRSAAHCCQLVACAAIVIEYKHTHGRAHHFGFWPLGPSRLRCARIGENAIARAIATVVSVARAHITFSAQREHTLYTIAMRFGFYVARVSDSQTRRVRSLRERRHCADPRIDRECSVRVCTLFDSDAGDSRRSAFDDCCNCRCCCACVIVCILTADARAFFSTRIQTHTFVYSAPACVCVCLLVFLGCCVCMCHVMLHSSR